VFDGKEVTVFSKPVHYDQDDSVEGSPSIKSIDISVQGYVGWAMVVMN
jgi:hypothetical protein